MNEQNSPIEGKAGELLESLLNLAIETKNEGFLKAAHEIISAHRETLRGYQRWDEHQRINKVWGSALPEYQVFGLHRKDFTLVEDSLFDNHDQFIVGWGNANTLHHTRPVELPDRLFADDNDDYPLGGRYFCALFAHNGQTFVFRRSATRRTEYVARVVGRNEEGEVMITDFTNDTETVAAAQALYNADADAVNEQTNTLLEALPEYAAHVMYDFNFDSDDDADLIPMKTFREMVARKPLFKKE